jgi:hypothetical protein
MLMLARAPGTPTLRRGPLFERLIRMPGNKRSDFLKDQPNDYPFSTIRSASFCISSFNWTF